MDKMIIEHTDGRRVEGVGVWAKNVWVKKENSMIIHHSAEDGWREVQEKKRIDVTGECTVDEDGDIFHDGDLAVKRYGYTRSLVTRHHLPEDVYDRFTNSQSNSFAGFLKQFECQVIVIERDQP